MLAAGLLYQARALYRDPAGARRAAILSATILALCSAMVLALLSAISPRQSTLLVDLPDLMAPLLAFSVAFAIAAFLLIRDEWSHG